MQEVCQVSCGIQSNYKLHIQYNKDWDSDVSIVTGYELDVWGVGVPSPGRGKIFLLSTLPTQVLGPTQHPIQWVPGALSPRIKQLRHEADHLNPTSAKVKNMWIYTSIPPYNFIVYPLIMKTQLITQHNAYFNYWAEMFLGHLNKISFCTDVTK
jgi:hypothetical protein